jgi:hypothetical protein
MHCVFTVFLFFQVPVTRQISYLQLFLTCELKMISKCHIWELKNRLNADGIRRVAGLSFLICGFIMFSRKLVLSLRAISLEPHSNVFMYRRPTLCTLHIAVDFLKSLEIAVVWGGGVVLGYCAYIISL